MTMPSYKLQVIQVTTGKRARGWTYSGRPPPCGVERISGSSFCARAPRPPLEGVGARMALSPGRPVVYSTAELVRIAMFSWGGIGAARPERVHFGKRCQFRLCLCVPRAVINGQLNANKCIALSATQEPAQHGKSGSKMDSSYCERLRRTQTAHSGSN